MSIVSLELGDYVFSHSTINHAISGSFLYFACQKLENKNVINARFSLLFNLSIDLRIGGS